MPTRNAFESSVVGLQHLLIFYRASTLLSFTRAGEVTGVGQPAVSRRLKELERILGHRLFERMARGVALTPAGERLRSLLAAPLEELMQVPGRLEQEMASAPSTEIVIAGGQQLLLSFLAPALFTFQRRHPELRVSVLNLLKPDIIDSVRRETADLGLVSGEEIPPDLEYHEVKRDRLCLLVPAGHPLAARRSVELAEVARHRLLLPDPRSSTRKLVEEALRVHSLQFRIGMELERWEVIREFVAMGLGVAVLPGFVAGGMPGARAIPIAHPFPPRSYGMVTSRSCPTSPLLGELMDAVGASIEDDDYADREDAGPSPT